MELLRCVGGRSHWWDRPAGGGRIDGEARRGAQAALRTLVKLTLAGTLLGACVEFSAPVWDPIGYLAAYGVVLVGSDTAAVIVERGLDGGTAYEAVVDAEVTIVHHGMVTSLRHRNRELPSCRRPAPSELRPPKGEDGCYSELLAGPLLLPGDTVGLLGTLQTGTPFSGGTVLPTIPQVSDPPPGSRYTVPFWQEPLGSPLLTIPVEVGPMEGAARLEVVGQVKQAWAAGELVPGWKCETRTYAPPSRDPGRGASLRLRLYDTTCRDRELVLPVDSIDLRVTVTGYDPNYASYVDAMAEAAEISRAAAAFGLRGALGVFGSAAQEARVVRIALDS